MRKLRIGFLYFLLLLGSVVSLLSAQTISTSQNPICAGNSVFIEVQQVTVQSWSNGMQGNRIEVTPSQTTTYTATYMDAQSQTLQSISATVVVNALPDATISGNLSVCPGTSTTLTVPLAASYLWSNGATTPSITVLPMRSTDYWVEVTSAQGCVSRDTVRVDVHTLPSLSIDGATEVCAGSGTFLTVDAGYRYFWNTGDTTASLYVSPLTTTNYTVTVTDQNGCSQVLSHMVSVIGDFQADVVGPTAPICSGSTAVLTATGGNYYSWSHGLGNSAVVTVSPLVTTTYFVSVTNNQGCTKQLSYTVNVSSLPIPTVTGALTVCRGDSTILTASSADSYMWSDATGTLISTSPTLVVTPQESTDYTLTVYNSEGCQASRTVRVTVADAPSSLTITGPDGICSGDRAILTVDGSGYFYSWNTGETTPSITVAPLVNTTYTCTVTTLEGCSVTLTKSVAIHPKPQITIVGDSLICSDDWAVLTASGGTTYRWNTGDTTATIRVKLSSTTSFSVSASAGGGCWGSARHVVRVTPRPVANIVGVDGICVGASVRLTASGGDSFRWSTGETTRSITVTPTETSSYSVWSSYQGCESLYPADHTVVVYEPIDAQINGATSICQGDSILLTATGGNSFLWSTGAITSSIVVRPVVNTTYSCKVYDVDGCEATVTHSVTVEPIPQLSVAGNLIICQGEYTTLRAQGAHFYSWSGPVTANADSIRVAPLSTTTYYLTGYGVNGCESTLPVTVVVHDFADVVIDGYKNICAGASTTLSVVGNDVVSYLWSTGATSPTIQVSPAATTTYTVDVVNQNGCQKQLTVTVQVGAAPTPLIDGPTEVCQGEVIQLTASLPDGSEAQLYQWSNGQTGKTITISPASSTTYTVTAVLPGGCSATASQLVTVRPMTYAAINGATNACSGKPVVLTANGGDTYVWDNGMTGAMITVFPDKTTLYEVTVTNAYGCVSKATHLVTIDPLPHIMLTGDSVICEGGSATLVAVGGASYMWNNGSIANSIIVSPAVTTTYQVQVTAASGCDTTLFHTVYVNAQPQGDITGNFLLCAGEATTLTATGGVSYYWSNGASSPSITETPTVTTTYSVVITNAEGCSQTVSRSVVVNPLPVPVLSGVTDICEGEQTTLTATGAGTGGYYIWSTGEQSSSITVRPTATTTYSVIAVSRFGCQSTPIFTTVQVHTPPRVTIAGNRVICPGGTTLLTAQGNSTRYLWSTGDTTASLQVNLPGTYILQGYTAQGCMTQASVTVVEDDLSQARIMASEEYICAGELVTLTATGGDSYVWSTGALTSSIQVNPAVTTDYSVVVYTALGCQKTLTKKINVNEISITGNVSICRGEQTALTAFGLGSTYYVWSTGDSTQTITVAPTQTTTYYVNAYSPRGCDVYGTITVQVYDFPTGLSLAGPDTICANEMVMLTAVGGSTGTNYLWSTGARTPSIRIQPQLTQDYWCRYTAGASCDTLLVHRVVVEPRPTARITAPASVCLGDTVTLMASGGQRYLWDAGLSTSQYINVSPRVTTTYQLVAFNEQGCTDTVYHTVQVNALPRVIVTGSNSACVGQPTLLVASDGTTTSNYVWSNGMTGDSIWAVFYATETLTVTCYNVTGCVSTATHRVTAYDYPVPFINGETEICLGTSTVITATGGTSYLWSTGSRAAAIRVNPTISTTYWVDVTGPGACTVRDSIHITVKPRPSIAIYANGDTMPVSQVTICRGSSVTLTGVGAGANGSYSWRNQTSTFTSTNASIVVSPTVAAYYYLTITDQDGCTNNMTIRVNVSNPINGSIQARDTVCSGASTVLSLLNVPTNSTYLWSTGETTRSITVTPQSSTTYSCEVRSVYGCDTLYHKNITVLPSPTGAITAPNEICEGEVALLIVSGGDYYTWNNGVTADRIAVRPTFTTTYSVQITNMNGCTETLSHTVVVNNKPPVAIVGNTACCTGDSVMLYATDGTSTTTYVWDNGSIRDTIWVKPLASETYRVIATSQAGCVDTAYHTITLHTYDDLTIIGDTEICQGSGTTISIQGGIAWNWSTGATMQTVWLQPSIATTYWVDVTSPGGCVERLYVPITLKRLPQASIWLAGDLGASTSTTICSGHQVMLEGHGAGSNGNYIWMDVLGNRLSTNQTITVSPTATQTFYLEVENEDGCFHTTWFTVHVLPHANMNVSASSTAICQGGTSTLRCGTPNDGLTYNWSDNEGMTFTGTSLLVQPDHTTTYYVSTTTGAGCISQDSITIQVFPDATATISGPSIVCPGDTVRLTASDGSGYLWSNGATTQSIIVAAYASQWYSVEVVNAAGCLAYADHYLETYDPMQLIIAADDTIYVGESTTLTASGAVHYYWSNGQNGSTITVAPLVNTTYHVTGVDGNGCSSTVSINVVVINFNPIIIGDEVICLGESSTLTVDAGLAATYLWNTGETTQSITVTPQQTTTYSVDVTTQTGAQGKADITVTVLQPPIVMLDASASVCQDDAVAYFNFTITAGIPYSYSLYADQAAQAVGFPAISADNLLVGQDVEITIPTGIPTGTYHFQVVFTGNDGCVGQTISISLEVLKADMIVLKWNDVLICDNITQQYVGYQWYKDGRPIHGATMQYYSETGGFDGTYYVVATKTDGTEQKSCPITLFTRSAPQQIQAQPNPVKRFHTMNLTLPFDNEELTDAYIRIFDMTGRIIETRRDVTQTMQLNIPYTPGMYLLMVYLNDGTNNGIKFLVNE